MDRIKRNTSFLIALVSATAVGFGHLITTEMLPLVLALPILIRLTKTPGQAVAVAYACLLGSSYGLFLGIAVLSDFLIALLAWLGISALLSLPWLLSHLRWCGIVIAITLMTVPPLGFLTHVSPLIIGGFLFPGLGFIGVFLSVLVFQALYLLPLRFSASIVVVMLASTTLFSIPTVAATINTSNTFTAQNMTAGQKITIGDCCEADHQAHEILLKSLLVNIPDSRIPVYPEATAGRLTDTTKRKLVEISRATNQAFFIGGEEQVGKQYNNVLLLVTKTATKISYRQRIPALWFMWRGQNKSGFFRAGLNRPATFIHGNRIIGALICYEISAPVVILATHVDSPAEIIVISNLWWGRATNLPHIMRIKAGAWSRLFNVPYLLSVNI